MIKYIPALDIQTRIIDISRKLFPHVKIDHVCCIRSVGSSSRGTIARCHALSKIWQKSLGIDAKYIVEVISERFDRMNDDEKTRTLIHELMHIPKSFGGGFKHHDYVCERNVKKLHNLLKEINEKIIRESQKNLI
jgi:predicted metallopeptidase